MSYHSAREHKDRLGIHTITETILTFTDRAALTTKCVFFCVIITALLMLNLLGCSVAGKSCIYILRVNLREEVAHRHGKARAGIG